MEAVTDLLLALLVALVAPLVLVAMAGAQGLPKWRPHRVTDTASTLVRVGQPAWRRTIPCPSGAATLSWTAPSTSTTTLASIHNFGPDACRPLTNNDPWRTTRERPVALILHAGPHTNLEPRSRTAWPQGPVVPMTSVQDAKDLVARGLWAAATGSTTWADWVDLVLSERHHLTTPGGGQ